MDAATLTYDTLRFGDFEDFPETTEPVWILGTKYSALTGAICFLINGMCCRDGDCAGACKLLNIIASVVHFQADKDEIFADVTSRLWFTYRKNFSPIDWRWVNGNQQRDEYYNVLNAFLDKKDSYYSIHQIAQMGVGEGKSIGQWYGPNTAAQVLKKLTFFDNWSLLAVHVAMDNTVIIDDIKMLCQSESPCGGAAAAAFPQADGQRPFNGYPSAANSSEDALAWKPLVLLIPLRLGLSEINEAYIKTLKRCFMLPQSLGVIGGKPNSAHYFIGYVEDELIYLDPHTTQPVVETLDDFTTPDESFHCQHPPCRMNICDLDPSIAVGFFCSTEEDFNDWCKRMKMISLEKDALPMFELMEHQTARFPDVHCLTPDFTDSERLERFFDSEDEDFEILSL
uniref:cysteine protease ATG4B isoform X3 n=1 Tax=Pristiophorus japonicus TaxID=55135 RepID=UPI00398E5DEE